jgi:hypothetical protein
VAAGELKLWLDIIDKQISNAPAFPENSGIKTLERWESKNPMVGIGADLDRLNGQIATIPTGLSEADNNMLVLIESTKRGTKAAKDLKIQWGEWTKEQQEGFKKSQQVQQEVSTIMTDLNRGLARAIIHWKGFREVAMSALTEIGEAILRMIIKQLLESTRIVEFLTKKLIQLINLIPKVNIPVPGGNTPQVPTGPSTPSGGGGGSTGGGGTVGAGVQQVQIVSPIPLPVTGVTLDVGKATGGVISSAVGGAISGGLTGAIGAISSAVTAVSSIISNFQQARQETTLNAIEWNTRKSSIHLEYLLEKANEFWPYLQHINNTLWTPGAPGGVGGTQITINYTGDVRSLAMMLLSELQRQGLRVAPA